MLQDYYSPASGQYALIRFERSEQQFFRSIRLGPASDHISLHDRIESAVTKFALEETEFQGCSWRMVRTHEQQFNGSLFPKHLLPHLVQGSASLGLTLSDYTARLEADPAFLQSQREWLLLPFETVYGLSREGTGAVSGDWSNNFVEFLNNNTQSLGWALPEVVKLIKTKSEARDYKLKIVSAGCGPQGCEVYGWCLVVHEILRSVAQERFSGASGPDNQTSLAEKWIAKWDVNITGLSVDFNHLQKAEGAWRVECDNALVNAPRMPEFARRALLSGTRRVTKPYAPDRVTLEILPERLKQVTFAWIDLFNDDLAPQLGSQNDLVISENALYIYDNICFPPLRPAIDRLVNSLGPGGLLVLDSNIAAVIKIIDTSRYLPLPQSLYFSHPKLIELPLPQDYRYASHVHLLTSQMIDEFAARPELDDDEDMIFRYSKWLHEKGYGPEIDARGGRQPSGLYRKIDQTI